MNWLKKIKSWPIEKKRIFSLVVAILLTILIIVFNSAINIWREDNGKSKIINNSAASLIKKSFSEIFSDIPSVFEQVSSNTSKIIEQINTASSSLSTTTNIVE